MNKNELRLIQNYPLELKILKSEQRIREWVDYYGEDGVYVSFSGGKDSTVLLHLVRKLYPNIKAVFIDTGLEFPEIKEFVKTFDNVDIVKPKMSFKQVIDKYGYPVVTKEQSNYIHRVRNTKSQGEYNKYYHGINRDGTPSCFKIAEKNKYLLDSDFKISDKCCDKLKKDPVKLYEKKTGRVPIVGTMAYESTQRERMYLKTGCNAFDRKRPVSCPLGFWLEQDILEYIVVNSLPIASVYGEVVSIEGKYKTTGQKRTGCIFCMLGVHLEKSPNRFEQLKITHPHLYRYCMENLGLKEVLEFMNIKH